MKKLRRWVGICFIALAVVSPILFSITALHGEAFAETNLTSSDISAIKQNILYKAVYSNLQKCYNNMQGTIDETQNNVWATFDSATYFKSDALASNFLKFPFDVGKNNESSCPKMITGWKTNWFVNLFGGNGNYSGLLSLNTGAEVPDSSYDNSPTKMGNFLKNIGYTQKTDTTTMGDRKCFYLKFQINSAAYDKYWLPTPSSGTTFETVDYCVKLDGNNLQQYSDSIITLTGNNEYFGTYDDGHLKDESNIVFIYFNTSNGMAPGFYYTDYSGVSWANKNYLQANLTSYIDLRYYFDSATVGHTMEATSIPVKYINNTTNAENSTYCSNLGYTWCGWVDKGILYTKTYIGSLTNPGDSISYSTFKSRMKTLVEHMQDTDGIYLFSNVSAVDFTPGATSYTKGATNTKFMNYFLGNTSNFNGGTLSNAEKYVLYYTYLKESYNVATTTTAISNGVQVSWLNDDGTFTKTYVYDPDENLNDKKYVPQNSQWLNIEELNWKQIAERMAAIDVSTAFDDVNITDPVLDPAVTPTDPGNNVDGDAGIFDGCISNAGVLGWIICPVTRIVGEAVKGVYTDIADNYLTMKSATMTSNSLRSAWSQFQGYANILFSILLVFVILSQVTGIGLSNYGIKKVLPRLVITIILVNLSFIMCSVAVDLSNILGVRLDELFSNIDVGGVVADDLNLGTLVGNTLTSLTGATASVAVGAGIISVVIATEAWKFMILPLLLTLLTAFIGIIFFYVILGVRQAAIVLLVAISPIAVVCYALPNTQKLFSRWLKIFADLLMVFPICGILMGGGNFASRLLLTAGGDVPFMYFLIAMLLSVVPFFFIPTILKGSMTAMGNLGMKISNMGSRLGSWSERTIRGTRAFQDHQQEALRESNMARDKGIMNRYRDSVKRLSAKEKDGTITKREQQQLNRARYRLNRASGRRERAIMEDLQASVNATREELEPGTERYKTTRDRLARRQAAEEARGLTELYDAGIASKIDGSGKLDTSDEDAVVAELDAIMSKLDANPEDNDALAKMQALSSSMMGKGEFGENVLRSALERHVAGQIRGSRRRAAENSGLRQLSNFISSGPLGGRLKADDRDTFDMATALAKGEKYYSDPDGFSRDFGVDASGNIVHNKFAHGSAGKLSARGLADSNDALLDRIEAAVSGGDISGTELNTLMQNVDEALNNDTIQLKTGVRQKLENIARQAYVRTGGTATARTANSTSASIMANSSSNTLDAMLSRVQNYANLSPADQAAQADELRVMAENAKYALENDIVKDTATAERLQNIVEAVRSQGISDFAGNTGGNSFKLNSGSFKIRGVQAEQHASVPTGWKKNSTAPGGYTVEISPGNYRNLNTQELEQLKEIQAFNRQVDMRNSSRGLDGSGAGSP